MKGNLVLTVLLTVSCLPISAQVRPAKPASPPQRQAADAADRKQLAAYLAEFRNDPNNSELRYKIIGLAKTLTPAPAVPPSAKADFTGAATHVKSASSADDFRTAAAVFERVAVQAPWYAEAYFNAASAYAKAADYDGAERDLALYMAAARQGDDTSKAEKLQRDLDEQRFQQALQEFQKKPSEAGRKELVKLAQQLQPAPKIPEEAKQYFAKAKELATGASKPEDLSEAVAEFRKALLIAPWWSDAVHDFSLVVEPVQFRLAVDRLHHVARYSDEDQRAREAIIKAVLAMPTPPPTPDDVLRAMVRAQMRIKQGNSFQTAVDEMEQAVLAAPWLAEAYLNLALVQEKAEMFQPAIQNLKLCLLAAPQSPNLATVKTKIYELEMMNEQAVTTQGLQGEWKNANCSSCSAYTVKVEGNKIRIGDWDLVKTGHTLEGSTTIGGDALPHPRFGTDDGKYFDPCRSPNETVPVSGSISDDGKTIELTWMASQYNGIYKDTKGMFNFDPKITHCDTVVFTGKEKESLKLQR